MSVALRMMGACVALALAVPAAASAQGFSATAGVSAVTTFVPAWDGQTVAAPTRLRRDDTPVATDTTNSLRGPARSNTRPAAR